MNMILAQAAATKVSWEFLALLASIAGNAAMVVALMVRGKQKVRVGPQPLGVEGKMDVTSRGKRFNSEACDAKHKTLDERVEALDEFTRNEIDRLHDKVDVVDRRHADSLRQAITEINHMIGELPGKIISLLRHTGQLKNHHE